MHWESEKEKKKKKRRGLYFICAHSINVERKQIRVLDRNTPELKLMEMGISRFYSLSVDACTYGVFTYAEM